VTFPMTLSDLRSHFSTVVALCVQLTHDLLAVAKFLILLHFFY